MFMPNLFKSSKERVGLLLREINSHLFHKNNLIVCVIVLVSSFVIGTGLGHLIFYPEERAVAYLIA